MENLFCRHLNLSKTGQITLQWIPAHCGVPENELADKEGAMEDPPNTDVSYQEMSTIINAMRRPRQDMDPYHVLSRPEQVILVRLRTGHNRLNAHMCKKLKLVPTAVCPCGEGEQTTEHVFQHCKRHDQERSAIWPTGTTIHQKLHGDAEDLIRTTECITTTGLTV